MRTVALIIIAIACAMTGSYVAHSFKMRVRLLRKTEIMICTIRNEINYTALPADDLFRMLAQKDNLNELGFILPCSKLILAGDDFPTAWKKALSDRRNTTFLRRKDVQLIESFGENFGITDTQGQLTNCSLYLELLKVNSSEALKEKEQYSRLAYAMGLLCGLGLIIVLL